MLTNIHICSACMQYAYAYMYRCTFNKNNFNRCALILMIREILNCMFLFNCRFIGGGGACNIYMHADFFVSLYHALARSCRWWPACQDYPRCQRIQHVSSIIDLHTHKVGKKKKVHTHMVVQWNEHYGVAMWGSTIVRLLLLYYY